MSSAPKPTAILIVHGGYFLPPAWDSFSKGLEASGLVVSCPRLPTCGDSRPPKAVLKDDVAAVRIAAQALIEQGHTFAVLAHSYGGIVASEAITNDLYWSSSAASERDASKRDTPEIHTAQEVSPTTTGATHLLYLSAWLIPPNSSFTAVISKHGFQCQVDLAHNEDGTAWAKNAPESFYNDIDPVRAAALAESNVTHNLFAVQGDVQNAPWRDLPTAYIHCLQDKAIELPLQRGMVADALEERVTEFRTCEIDAAHCPFLSRPVELRGLVEEVVGVGTAR